MEEANETEDKQRGEETGVDERINWINSVSLVMNRINPVSLVGRIICLYRLYSENKQETYSVRDFVHKIESIIIYISEI